MTEAPRWLLDTVDRAGDVDPHFFSRFLPPPGGTARRAGVLLLVGPRSRPQPPTPGAVAEAAGAPDAVDGAEIVLTERAHSMRSHAGQVSFPGGSIDPGDDGPVGAALREAHEEVWLDPASVDVLATLPELYMPDRDFGITPVLAWWREPHPLHARSAEEVAAVVHAPLAELADPADRFQVTHPSGYTGPAFEVDGLLVWGFTAGVLDRFLRLAGLEQPWDRRRLEPLPERLWS